MNILQPLNELALALGYLTLLGIVCVAALIVSLLWAARDASDDAKAAGDRIGRETPLSSTLETVLASDMEQALADVGDDVDLSYEPQPVASFDWSRGHDRLEKADVLRAGGGLKAADFYVHPFPRAPDHYRADGWEWTDRHVGVWLDEPTFYVEGDDGRREVETDLSEWEPTMNDAKDEPENLTDWDPAAN